MSAIYGLIHLDDRQVEEPELGAMTRALLPYGADGGGTWKHGAVGLGQRLRCFTPEDRLERQPLLGAQSQSVLVMDGRLDNRDELAHELGIAPAETRQMPDSAFLLAAYEKWGIGCPERLVGAFTFALCDLRESFVLIARSGMGERSLYYHATPRTFAFASAPKGLFALPFVPRRIHEQTIADYLISAPRETGTSLFAGVSTLPPGHAIVVRREGVTLREFWRPCPRGKQTRFARDDEYVEAFTALLERVVRDHSRSLTSVGVSMSGGLDSTSVAAVAAGQMAIDGRRLSTFTEVPRAGFEGSIMKGRYADETPYVQAMARKYENLDPDFVCTDGSFYLDGIEDLFDVAEAPFRNASNRVWIEAILREAGGRGVNVLLTGGSGNLTISWPGTGLLPGLAATGHWLRCWREASAAAAKTSGLSALRVLFSQLAMPALPAPLWRTVQRLKAPENPMFRAARPWLAYSPIRPEFAAGQRVDERAQAKAHDFAGRPLFNYSSVRARIITGDLRADILRGHAAMFGVDKRDPTGDQRIVEFCLSLPEDQCRRDGETRWLIRRAMQGRLPPEVLNSRARGLQAADWFERLKSARSVVERLLERLAQSELARAALDLDRMRALVAEMDARGRNAEQEMLDYRGVLEFGLMTGSFLVWFESAAERNAGR